MIPLLRPQNTAASVIVAKARLHGDVQLDVVAPPSIHVRAGQDLHVKIPYRAQEASDARETFRVRLTSSLDGHKAKPSEARGGDKPGWPDEVWGSVEQQYRKLARGTHRLVFQAEATLRERGWGELEERRYEDHWVDGEVTVIVE